MKNKVIHHKGYVEVQCDFKGKIYKVLVDNEDFAKFDFTHDIRVMYTHGKHYCYTRLKGKQQLLHRYILNASKGQEVTFLDGDSLNLRRANIDFANRNYINRHKRLQCNNESGYPGVTWSSRDDNWVVRLYKDGKQIYIGAYRDKSVAIKERRKAERKYYPED